MKKQRDKQGKEKAMVINRQTYKKVKRMDHQQMSDFLQRYYQTIYRDAAIDFDEVLAEAIRRTKGIGNKIGTLLAENFTVVMQEKAAENMISEAEM